MLAVLRNLSASAAVRSVDFVMLVHMFSKPQNRAHVKFEQDIWPTLGLGGVTLGLGGGYRDPDFGGGYLDLGGGHR